MDTRVLQRTDLNLLLVLYVLLEERSVSRAAERLFITQPAVSKALGRLRDAFRDVLFTRSAHGMQPTPRALELGEELSGILHNIEQLVAPKAFNPAESEHSFNITMPSFSAQSLLPALMADLTTEAPGIYLNAIPSATQQLERLADGSLDIALHAEYASYAPEFIVKRIGAVRTALMMRDDHPGLSETNSLGNWKRFPRVRLFVPDSSELALFKARKQLDFGRVVLETAHPGTALEVLRRTDCVMVGPPFVLQNSIFGQGITAINVPALSDQEVKFNLVRHRRTSASPPHIWLWQKLLGAIEKVSGVQRVRVPVIKEY